jgi:hypothetical protein
MAVGQQLNKNRPSHFPEIRRSRLDQYPTCGFMTQFTKVNDSNLRSGASSHPPFGGTKAQRVGRQKDREGRNTETLSPTENLSFRNCAQEFKTPCCDKMNINNRNTVATIAHALHSQLWAH